MGNVILLFFIEELFCGFIEIYLMCVWCIASQLERVAMKLQSEVSQGTAQYDAWNNNCVQLVNCAKVIIQPSIVASMLPKKGYVLQSSIVASMFIKKGYVLQPSIVASMFTKKGYVLQPSIVGFMFTKKSQCCVQFIDVY